MAWVTPVDRYGQPEAFASVVKAVPRASLAAGGSVTVWTPAAGKRIRLLSFHLTASAATVLTVRLGSTVVWERDIPGAGGVDVLLPTNGVLGGVDAPLTVTSSAAATVGATAIGAEE